MCEHGRGGGRIAHVHIIDKQEVRGASIDGFS